MHTTRGMLLVAAALGAASTGRPAAAQDATKRIDAIEAQITQLTQELKRVRSELAARDGKLRAAQASANQAQAQAAQAQAQAARMQPAQTAVSAPPVAPGSPAPAQVATAAAPGGLGSGAFQLGGVTVTLGGFAAAEGVYRTRNDVADIGSNFNTLPLAQSPNYHTGEFRGTARQSRLSLLTEARVDDDQKLSAYFETDFLGVGTTSNSTETNSYNLRLRQAYATYDNTALGLHFLGGQAWSMLTLNKTGITPRQEDIPLTIDAQYVPGFNWKRQWQVRLDKDLFDRTVWLGASLEEPQASYYTGPNGLGVASGTTATITNPGGSQLNATNNYSDDIAPDLIVKAAFDPGWGHYEVYGVGRLLHDRVSTVGNGHNNTTPAGGGGAGAILPIIPKMVDVQVSGLAGAGIGSYGSGQLPDAIVSPAGSPRALQEYTILGGIIAHPVPEVDIYGYGGTEQITRSSFNAGGKAYGYGNPLYANGGCGSELSPLTCVANTSGITQGTVGGWWRLLKGNYGTLQVGAQYSYTERSIFSGVGVTAGSHVTPSTDDNMMLFSVRYFPFQ